MICDDKAAKRAIDEELGKGGSAAFVARLMTFRGFEVSDQTISEHKKHAAEAVPPGIAKTRKDFATMVRDKAATLLDNGELDLTEKNHAGGIMAGLKAQAELNKQANKSDDRKTSIAIAMLLGGTVPPAHLLLEDGHTIEGEYDVVEDPDEDEPE